MILLEPLPPPIGVVEYEIFSVMSIREEDEGSWKNGKSECWTFGRKRHGNGPKGGSEIWGVELPAYCKSTWYAPSSGQMNDKCETKYMISLVFSFSLLIFLLPLNFYCGYQWLLSVWIYFVVFIFKIKKAHINFYIIYNNFYKFILKSNNF